MVKKISIAEISLEGGRVCLDFINTVHNRKSESLEDYLLNDTDLISWAEKAGVITPGHVKNLKGKHLKSTKWLESVRPLRELLYRLFLPISQGTEVRENALNEFNLILPEYFPLVKINTGPNGFVMTWNLREDDVRLITAPVVMDAYELLLSEKINRVKECPKCGWLFLDTTKNGKRKWCSMQACGSTVKALEWYHRNKTV